MSSKLTFGYLYDFRNPPQWRRPWSELYGEMLDIIAWTETAGFTGAWVPEHHLADDGYMPSPLIALAAIAQRTSTMKIGTAIALAPLYNPVRFATDCAVLDILAGGRLELALAIGYRRRETAAFGVDFTRRGAIFDEFLEIATRLWTGETVSYSGKHFTAEKACLMPRAPRGNIPLYIGGFADKALDRIARFGSGYIGTAEICELYLAKLAEQGKDPAAAKVRITDIFYTVADDPEAAMEELAPYYHHVNNSYGAWNDEDKALGTSDGPKPMSLDEFKASGMLQILTPEQAIARYRDLQSRMPLEHAMMMLPSGVPAKTFIKYAEIFARDVIPAFS